MTPPGPLSTPSGGDDRLSPRDRIKKVLASGTATAPPPATTAPGAQAARPAAAPSPRDPDLDADPEHEPLSVGDRIRNLLSSGGDKEPFYPRLLRLQHVHPNGWQRAALVEGMALVGALAALADRATAWAPLILPIGTAAVVKFHDVLAGVLPKRERAGDDTP